MQLSRIRSLVRTIPDYPKPGIMFRDITGLMEDAEGFGFLIDALLQLPGVGQADIVVGIEARGFIIAGAMAHQLGKGFVPIRKKGKLPRETISEEYELEYGMDAIEMHAGALRSGQKVLLVDDLIATGGTASAAACLVKRSGAQVHAACFAIDLPDLGGRDVLTKLGIKVQSLVTFLGD